MRTLNVFDITMCVFDSLSSINPEREKKLQCHVSMTLIEMIIKSKRDDRSRSEENIVQN